MSRCLHDSLAEFKPYHESTVATLGKRVVKRRATMKKYTQCVTAYKRELEKAKGQSKGNSFVSAEDNPAVIGRLEEQNQAQYLFQEEHNKLLEQINALKNRHESLVSLHLRTILAHEVTTCHKVFEVVSRLAAQPLQEAAVQDVYQELGVENRGEFGDLVVDPGKAFFEAQLKFWREYLRTVQAFQRTLIVLLKNLTNRADNIMTFFAELCTFVDPVQLHPDTAKALADAQKSYGAVKSSGFTTKFAADVKNRAERLRSSAADMVTHLTHFIPRRRNLCAKFQRNIKKHDMEVERAKKKSGGEFASAPPVVKAKKELDGTQAELQKEVTGMADMVRQMHCHREMHLSQHLSSYLELEMQTCGSLFTGLDYILQQMTE